MNLKWHLPLIKDCNISGGVKVAGFWRRHSLVAGRTLQTNLVHFFKVLVWKLRNYCLRRKVPLGMDTVREFDQCDPDVIFSNDHATDESMHEVKKRFPIVTRCHWLIVAYASRWVNDKRQIHLTGAAYTKDKRRKTIIGKRVDEQ